MMSSARSNRKSGHEPTLMYKMSLHRSQEFREVFVHLAPPLLIRYIITGFTYGNSRMNTGPGGSPARCAGTRLPHGRLGQPSVHRCSKNHPQKTLRQLYEDTKKNLSGIGSALCGHAVHPATAKCYRDEFSQRHQHTRQHPP